MTEKVLMNRCAALWLRGLTVPEILVEVCCILNEDKPASWLDARIRAWRKIKPELFPPRHKKHAPRRSKTSFDITLRFDVVAFGRHFTSGKCFDELTKKQQLTMIQKNLDLSGAFDPLNKLFTQILSIK